jgi:capsular exopolysaccharide synthesis family protein
VRFLNVDDPPRLLALTSPQPGDGKTTVVCNLAIVAAEAGSRVLIVDADLRIPRVADFLGLDGARGLTDLLGDPTLEPASVVIQAPFAENLWVLASGPKPPNPSELLASERMSTLIARFRSDYDLVLFDTPPVLVVTDAALLASKTQGVILVTRSRATNRLAIEHAVQALAQVDARLLGVVYNCAEADERASSSYYQYGDLGTSG